MRLEDHASDRVDKANDLEIELYKGVVNSMIIHASLLQQKTTIWVGNQCQI